MLFKGWSSRSLKRLASRRLVTPSIVLVLALTARMGATQAQTTGWTAGVGDWFVDTNWSNGVPAAGVGAGIQNGGTAQIGGVATAAGVSLGVLDSQVGTLEIGANGQLTAGSIGVGTFGTGTLDIQDGGGLTLNVPHNVVGAIIGGAPGGIGSATVQGENSSWTIVPGSFLGGELLVGNGGIGTLDILAGGNVADEDARIGNGAGGEGTATVDGEGSNWTNSGVLSVGRPDADGTLTIRNGGTVSASSTLIGVLSGTGDVTVEGPGSTLSTTNTLRVGSDGGRGTLAISNGATVTSNSTSVGPTTAGVSTASVTGAGSTLSAVQSVTIRGTLDVSEGGVVTGGSFGVVGGSAVFDGVGTRLDAGGNLAVNASTLRLENGATATSALGLVIGGQSAPDTVAISGVGSSWILSDTLNVDRLSSLIADDGANLAANSVNILRGSAVTIAGATSTMSVSDTLSVGMFETGVFNVQEGATLTTSGSTIVGDPNGSEGTVTLAGPGTSWTHVNPSVNENFIIGLEGTGTFNLIDGAVLTLDGLLRTMSLGRGLGGNGTLRIGNGGAAGIFNGDVVNSPLGQGTVVFDHNETDYNFVSRLDSATRGTLSVEHIGVGTTILSADSNYDGTTLVEAGTLLVTGALSGGGNVDVLPAGTLGGTGVITGATSVQGTLTPGISPGIITFESDLTLADTSSTLIELGGLVPGDEHDQIQVGGAAALDGALVLSVVAPFTVELNQLFTILEVDGTNTGQFIGLDEGAPVGNFGGLDLLITYIGGDGNDVVLFTAIPEPSAMLLLLAGVTSAAWGSRSLAFRESRASSIFGHSEVRRGI